MPYNERIEQLLDMLGNETRRRILKALAEEPRYFNELSRAVGVSQQAVLKHLELLVEAGVVTSFRAKSDLAGPDRKYYQLDRPFYLSIEVATGAVGIELQDLDRKSKREPEEKWERRVSDRIRQLEQASGVSEMIEISEGILKELDDEIQRLDKRKFSLMQGKRMIMRRVHEEIRGSFDSDLERRILYAWLAEGGHIDLETLSESLDKREKEVRQAVDSLQRRTAVRIPVD